MSSISIPAILCDLAAIFSKSGFSIYLVGGAVRDMLLRKIPGDFDIATNATPEQVIGLFKHAIPTGIEHGTVTIPFKGSFFECTTFRAEIGYADGRHPDRVEYAESIEEDLSRRDFCMNAIAASIPEGKLIDPYQGMKDIQSGIIRTVGNPLERFTEDGLRPIRALRFSSQLGFTIHQDTLNAIPESIAIIEKVSPERIRDEFIKILLSPKPSTALRLMEKTGILKLLIPELSVCRGIIQKGNHVFDVLDHLLFTCDVGSSNNLEVKLASLFHDIGKPIVRLVDLEGNTTFYLHEKKSAELARNIMERLKFPGRTTKEVCHLIENHMFYYESCWTDAAVRRFIGRVGSGNLENLFLLRYADSWAITGVKASRDILDELKCRIKKILDIGDALSIKDLAINGNDLQKEGIKPGPAIGSILNELLETVLDDPSMNTKTHLLEISKQIIQSRYA